MTIDARKIIFNLAIPLENVEWETLQNIKWEPLINETYDIIESVEYFTNSATRIEKQNSRRCVGGMQFKRDIWDYYYVSYSEELILSRVAF